MTDRNATTNSAHCIPGKTIIIGNENEMRLEKNFHLKRYKNNLFKLHDKKKCKKR